MRSLRKEKITLYGLTGHTADSVKRINILICRQRQFMPEQREKNKTDPQYQFDNVKTGSFSYNQNGTLKLQFNALPDAGAAPAFTVALPADVSTILHRSDTPYKFFTVTAQNAEAFKWYYVDAGGDERPIENCYDWVYDISNEGRTFKLMYDPAPDAEGLTTIVCYATAFGKAPARTECKVDFEYAVQINGSFLRKSTLAEKFPEINFRYAPYGDAETPAGLLSVNSNLKINVEDYYDDPVWGIYCNMWFAFTLTRTQRKRWQTKSSVCSVRRWRKCDFFVNMIKKSLTIRIRQDGQKYFDLLRCSFGSL